jgi:hypothetical protein
MKVAIAIAAGGIITLPRIVHEVVQPPPLVRTAPKGKGK